MKLILWFMDVQMLFMSMKLPFDVVFVRNRTKWWSCSRDHHCTLETLSIQKWSHSVVVQRNGLIYKIVNSSIFALLLIYITITLDCMIRGGFGSW